MDIEALKNYLKQWLIIDTWHTGHPLDEKRFHEALKEAFNNLGNRISGGDFGNAIKQLVEEHHPNLARKFKESLIENFSNKAEQISRYLSDTE